jgi:hypothetical protein
MHIALGPRSRRSLDVASLGIANTNEPGPLVQQHQIVQTLWFQTTFAFPRLLTYTVELIVDSVQENEDILTNILYEDGVFAEHSSYSDFITGEPFFLQAFRRLGYFDDDLVMTFRTRRHFLRLHGLL